MEIVRADVGVFEQGRLEGRKDERVVVTVMVIVIVAAVANDCCLLLMRSGACNVWCVWQC
jgi:hypothetical protein